MANAAASAAKLGIFLDRLAGQYHRRELLSSDPLEFVHRYDDPLDQETVAVLAALLAYGNVKQIRRSVEDALSRMSRAIGEDAPAKFVRTAGARAATQSFEGFIHRFNVGADIVLLARLLKKSRERFGSLGGHLVSYLDPADQDFGQALSRLIADWKTWASKMSHDMQRGPYFYHLLTAPADGSCCKRWCMLFRWMGRRDELDPGLWTQNGALASGFPPGRFLRPDQLVLPLDTHTGRICGYLGLTRRKVLGWKAAIEITRELRACDPSDPTRYDFALSRLGILDLCQRKYRREICERCQLVSVCRFARAGAKLGK